ncbi:hypothetical protein CAL29_24360 [Bordetella genomosp. 10]|uniref:Uncharacterized protein n=1 Tax=Bordetella genomosp. 10 TaxID=1416804 RepID=A0A261S167_9BORD|nr:hypothetical protein CAL29_24360 [Bordetella genomosp. 10]
MPGKFDAIIIGAGLAGPSLAARLDAAGMRVAINVPGIWALGDCNGRGAFTHTAYNDFEIVAADLFDGWDRRVGSRAPKAWALPGTMPPITSPDARCAASRMP